MSGKCLVCGNFIKNEDDLTCGHPQCLEEAKETLRRTRAKKLAEEKERSINTQTAEIRTIKF